MNFNLTRQQKYLFISSIILLMLSSVLTRILMWFLVDGINPNWLHLKRMLVSSAQAYIWFVLINYFKFYGLRILKVLCYILFLLKVLDIFLFLSIILFDTHYSSSVVNYIFPVFSIIVLILLVYILRLKGKDYSALRSLKKYSYALIACSLIYLILGVTAQNPDFLPNWAYNLIPAIPNFFLIDFALKLNTKGENEEDPSIVDDILT